MSKNIVDQTVSFVKETLSDAEGGHDWWHIYRVWQNARSIAKGEPANLLVVELSALLHDIADAKFHNGDESIAPKISRDFLGELDLNKDVINHVVQIIENISFRKSFDGTKFNSLELQVVQDADRLDAIGAIGIARAFSYGGHKNRKIFDPNIPLEPALDKAKYVNSKAPTIHHFYEKLLLLQNQMNTKTGKKMANERHVFMQQYLDQFFREWPSEMLNPITSIKSRSDSRRDV